MTLSSTIVFIKKHYIIFSIIVVIILGLAIGLPLGLLLNKSSSGSSSAPGAPGTSDSLRYTKSGMGWHKSEITGEVVDIENTFYQGKSLGYYADNDINGCQWRYDSSINNRIELIIPTTSTNADMLKTLGKIIKDPTSTNYYSPDYYLKDHYYVNIMLISPYADSKAGDYSDNPVYNYRDNMFIYGPLPQ